MAKFALLSSAALFFTAVASPSNLWAQPLVNVETVTVGDAGNAPDNVTMSDGSGNYGSVSYEFKIGKFEVSIGEYTTFLNTVASSSNYAHIRNLWHPAMQENLNIAGIERLGTGSPDTPYFYAAIGNSERPVSYVSWLDAARFCNWLHNGATNGASTETGAYNLNGATNGVILRNNDARWWIPSENEWYKAAYYKGGGTNVGYWFYPTQSNADPGNLIGSQPNQANYRVGAVGPWGQRNGTFAVTQSSEYSPTQNYLTASGSFSSSQGAYGTFDQGGNVFEWNEGILTGGGAWTGIPDRGLRGGDAQGYDYTLRSFLRGYAASYWESPGIGFRVATSSTSAPTACSPYLPLDWDSDGVNDSREIVDGTDQYSANSFNPLSKDLVAHYTFDGDVFDRSGYFRHFQQTPLFGIDRHGAEYRSARLLSEAPVATTELATTANAFVSFWLKLTNSPSALGERIILHGSHNVAWSDAAHASFGVAVWETGRIAVSWLNQDRVGQEIVLPEGTILTNRWYQVFFLADGMNVRFGVDGTVLGEASGTLLAANQPLSLGGEQDYFFDSGLIDDLRVYRRALTQEEITKLFYDEAFTAAERWFLAANPTVMGHSGQAEIDAARASGQSDVLTNPYAFNLYTAEQLFQVYTNGVESGIATVTNAPSLYGFVAQSDHNLAVNISYAQGIADVTNNLLAYGLRTEQDYYAHFTNGVESGIATVTNGPSVYGLVTQSDHDLAVSNSYSSGFTNGLWAGIEEVTNRPTVYGLIAQSEHDLVVSNSFLHGVASVTNDPSSFGLYTAESIMDLRMSGTMLPANNGTATVTFQPQTTTDLRSQPFTNNGTPITFELPMPADKAFMRWIAE